MPLFIIFTIAISLSMDAFSLSLLYGTLGLSKKKIYTLSFLVGIFHFFMPFIGNMVGSRILEYSKIGPNLIAFIVLSFIGVSMIFEKKEEDNLNLCGVKKLFLFAFAVSIDSFSVGIGLFAISKNHYFSSLVFAVTSFLFTFLGLSLGKKIGNILGKFSTIIGGLVLIIIAFTYLL